MINNFGKTSCENRFPIQKITRPDGSLVRWQVVCGAVGNAKEVKNFDTLGEIYDKFGSPSANSGKALEKILKPTRVKRA